MYGGEGDMSALSLIGFALLTFYAGYVVGHIKGWDARKKWKVEQARMKARYDRIQARRALGDITEAK